MHVRAIAIRIRFSAQRFDARFFRCCSVEVVFGEKEIHQVIITKRKLPAFIRKRAIGLQNSYVVATFEKQSRRHSHRTAFGAVQVKQAGQRHET
jgi:hypothetical protein